MIGGLACANYKDGVNITNVHSSVTITLSGTHNYTPSSSMYIGGLIGHFSADNMTINFSNCTVSGDINAAIPTFSSSNAAFVGGIMAGGRAGKPGCVNNLTNCTHSGKITLTQSGAKDLRVGGMIGDSERKSILTSCSNTGDITIDCAGYAYSTSNGSTGCGLGGLIGRQAAQVTDYDMTCTLTNCTNSGVITLKNALNNAYNVESSGTNGCVGQFVGKNLNNKSGGTYSEVGTCVKSGSVVITYTGQ